MFSREVYKDVTEQIINMLTNDIIEENGTESFLGWLENGEVFANNGLSDEEVDERMKLANKVNELVTNLAYCLDKNTEDYRADSIEYGD